MFSPRWKALGEMVDKCVYTTPGHTLSPSQSLHLFHAFLLQVRESDGTVYIAESGASHSLATHFANELTTHLKISAHALIPIHEDYTLPLAILLKKSDLLVAICLTGLSPEALGAAAMAEENDLPLITLTGHQASNPLSQQGDLNLHFDSNDRKLLTTGHFLLLEQMISSWTFETSPTLPKQNRLLAGPPSQDLSRGRRL